LIAKIDMIENKENQILDTAPIDKHGAEDVNFETLTPGQDSAGLDSWQRLLPSDEAMTILHTADHGAGRRPGFGYWLFVALMAASVFWVSGGHSLFTQTSSGTALAVDPAFTTGSITRHAVGK
jgi:hypothetical protein